MGGPTSSSGSGSSSGEEDGDADWKAAIESIAATTTFSTNGSTTTQHINPSISNAEADGEHQRNPQKLKHYQIKAQKLLDDMLGKALVMVKDPIHLPDNEPMINDEGVRLFKSSALGIVFDHVDEIQGPRKRPRILPGKEFDEKSKKFRRQLQSVAVDGLDILATASKSCKKSLARLEARDAAAKEKAKKEQDRVSELKKIRGERWLPSIAREMQLNRNSVK